MKWDNVTYVINFGKTLYELIYVLDNSDMPGPQDYCNSLNSTLNYTSVDDLNTYLATTQLSSDQQQSGNLN